MIDRGQTPDDRPISYKQYEEISHVFEEIYNRKNTEFLAKIEELIDKKIEQSMPEMFKKLIIQTFDSYGIDDRKDFKKNMIFLDTQRTLKEKRIDEGRKTVFGLIGAIMLGIIAYLFGKGGHF